MQLFPEAGTIRAVAIPLPGYSDLGTSNVYLVGSGPFTMIDTGPKFPGSFEYLKDQLKKAGRDMADIEHIIITHGHIDHYGLAVSIREHAGHHIPCRIHAEDLWRVTANAYREEMWAEEADTLMAMVDMPPREVRKIRDRFLVFDALSDPIPDALPMEDGDIFAGDDYHLEVIHTPGHSPGTCCLYEARQKILFSGDHILKHITPNPLFEIKRDKLRDPAYKSLKAYLHSLDKVASRDVSHVFPGHGEVIEELPGIISSYHGHHRDRMDRVWTALRKQSRPLYHLIDEVFDFVPEGDIFLAISEILVHLELLVEEGRAELIDPGPPAYYRAV